MMLPPSCPHLINQAPINFDASLGKCKKNTNRKRFTPEEDAKLIELCLNYQRVGDIKNWEDVSRLMPGRTARQCRDRYNITLKNYIEKKPWTPEEDEIIIRKYREIGPKWVSIAASLVGRSGNNVKNRWYKYINKEKVIEPFVPSLKNIANNLSPNSTINDVNFANGNYNQNYNNDGLCMFLLYKQQQLSKIITKTQKKSTKSPNKETTAHKNQFNHHFDVHRNDEENKNETDNIPIENILSEEDISSFYEFDDFPTNGLFSEIENIDNLF